MGIRGEVGAGVKGDLTSLSCLLFPIKGVVGPKSGVPGTDGAVAKLVRLGTASPSCVYQAKGMKAADALGPLLRR